MWQLRYGGRGGCSYLVIANAHSKGKGGVGAREESVFELSAFRGAEEFGISTRHFVPSLAFDQRSEEITFTK